VAFNSASATEILGEPRSPCHAITLEYSRRKFLVKESQYLLTVFGFVMSNFRSDPEPYCLVLEARAPPKRLCRLGAEVRPESDSRARAHWSFLGTRESRKRRVGNYSSDSTTGNLFSNSWAPASPSEAIDARVRRNQKISFLLLPSLCPDSADERAAVFGHDDHSENNFFSVSIS